MGAISTSMLCGRRPTLVNLTNVVVGMDDAGKTTILYKYVLGFDKPFPNTTHTKWPNVEIITYKKYSFQILDFGGADKVQPIYWQLYKDSPILIFVIDSADRMYVDHAKNRLSNWVNTNVAENLLLLVFANKQDLPNAWSVTEIIEKFELNTVKCLWHVQPCTALTGEGVLEGFEWLCKNLPK